MNIKRKEDLTQAILWLEYLLSEKVLKESTYQKYFEANPIVFEVLGYTYSLALTKASGKSLPRDDFSGLKPEPDFIARNDHGIYEIFELKTPIEKDVILDKNKYRIHFTSSVSSYISQAATYDDYFDNPANIQKVNSLFNINIQKKLPIKIIIGLNEYINKEEVYRQTTQYHKRIDFITYDDILNKLKNVYQNEFGQFENIPGLSFHVVFRVNSNTPNKRKYFVDIGDVDNLNKNRVSLYIDEKDNLCYEIIADNGISYKIHVEKDHFDFFNKLTYIVCEYASKNNGFYMSISVNGKEYETTLKHTYINVGNIQGRLTIGNDATHTQGFNGSLGMPKVFYHTIDYLTRQINFEEYNEKYNLVPLEKITI